MNILILGANGFIGSHLCHAIIQKTDWHITAIDLYQDKIISLLNHERFQFHLGDMTRQKKWVNLQIKKNDVVIPLAGIATPAMYIKNPLLVFELDFEANLHIIRLCVKHKKRIIFPSTSEVYGMCEDMKFDEETSHFVTGPIHKERWIYATSKQLLDRIMYAYGSRQQLSYTLFRPFNWYGPYLDDVFNANPGSSRVLSQFIGNIMRAEPMVLVNGGGQQRAFTFIDDGVQALLKIIENKNHCAEQRIFNIGNPHEMTSIRGLSELLIKLIKTYPSLKKRSPPIQTVDMDDKKYYGRGYQDVIFRTPAISRAIKFLQWQPRVSLLEGLKKTLDFYFSEDYLPP